MADGDEPVGEVDFAQLFLNQDAEDEDETTLAAVLSAMAETWPRAKRFKAIEVSMHINDKHETHDNVCIMREFFKEGADAETKITANAMGKKLKALVDAPIKDDLNRTLTLRAERQRKGGGRPTAIYHVEVLPPPQGQEVVEEEQDPF